MYTNLNNLLTLNWPYTQHNKMVKALSIMPAYIKGNFQFYAKHTLHTDTDILEAQYEKLHHRIKPVASLLDDTGV